MRRRALLTHLDLLMERSADCRQHLLAGEYRDLANECRELLPLASSPYAPATRLTRHLATLEASAGRPAPDGTLNGWEVLARARRRAL